MADAPNNPCEECGGEHGEHRPDCCLAIRNRRTTPHSRVDRAERALAEIQRHLREFNGFAPSPDLDLIDLR